MSATASIRTAAGPLPIPQRVVSVGALGLAASVSIGLFLEAVNAKPLPFLLIVLNLGVSFGVGLAMRTVWVTQAAPKSQAVLLAALTAPISIGVGTLLAGFLGSALATEEGAVQASQIVTRMLQDSTGLAVIVLGGAGVAAYATRASVPWLFLGVPMALYTVWIIGPTLLTGYIAMTNWDGITTLDKAPFVGLRNFDWLLNNANFWTAFGNNIRWLIFFVLIPTSMGLAMAMIFNGKFPGNRVFKIAFYSPLVIAPTVVGLVWESMYRPQDGLINSFLRLFAGPEAQLPGWLADRNLALWCIIIAAAWRQVGYVMILYLAGLKSLDTTLLEAAVVDGASPWERFRHVIFPLLGPVTVVVAVISVIDSLRAFDLVAIMTRGGPAYASEVLANFMYMRAFNDYRYGFAAATAVVLLVIMLFFIIPYLIRTARTELEY